MGVARRQLPFFYFQYFPAHCGAAFWSAFLSEEKVLIGEEKVLI